VILEGNGLTLVPLRVSDAAEMSGVLSSPELYEFTGGRPPTEAELTERYRRQVVGTSPGGDAAWLNWVVRVSGTAVGYVQATVPLDGAYRSAELAWVIGQRWQGRGLAGAAAEMVAGWLVSQGIGVLRASIAEGHAASEAVARRIGLRETDEVTDDGERLWISGAHARENG
jgi:RimJ/RimL family protein N-acetyltransferase